MHECVPSVPAAQQHGEFEIERTALDEVPEPPRGLGPELAVGLARNSTGLGRIEAY